MYAKNVIEKLCKNTENFIESMCKKSIFKKLLIKLTKECTVSVNNGLIKQINGCPSGGPIALVFTKIYMCKMEDDVVAHMKPIFYKRYKVKFDIV